MRDHASVLRESFYRTIDGNDRARDNWRDQSSCLRISVYMASGEKDRASGRPTGVVWEHPGE